MSKVQLFEQGIDPLISILTSISQHFQNGQNIIFHGEAAKYGRLLWQIPDAFTRSFVHGKVRHGFAFEGDLSCIRLA